MQVIISMDEWNELQAKIIELEQQNEALSTLLQVLEDEKTKTNHD